MEEPLGTVSIAPGVLITIARLTTLAVPGVSRMGQAPAPGPNRLLRRETVQGGVRTLVEDGTVSIDLYLIVERRVNMQQLAQQVQTDVTRAIQEIVGMSVRQVNVHIQDVEIAVVEENAAGQEDPA